MEEKIKVFVISDHPLSPSGVGTQTKYVCEALLKTGRYKIACFGGAIKHNDYKPQKVEGYNDDWVIFPTDGYGNPEKVRAMIRDYKPDILWFMTDPRFYEWLWMISNEIRKNIPMVYYHVWDNYPHPLFNKKFYDSNDAVVTISKVTDDIVKTVSPDIKSVYIPHAVNSDIFKKIPREKVEKFMKHHMPILVDHKRTTFFWNNRNARRKQSGSLLFWFHKFSEKVGKENVRLFMHTDPKDTNGQDLEEIIKLLGIDDGRVILSTKKVGPDILAMMYNFADFTINISDAEGFGLATLESLACGTPIIVNMTGGLTEQVTDGKIWTGIGLTPDSKAIIGSQQVPYIYEDRLSEKQVIKALEKAFYMSTTERNFYAKNGLEHIKNNYNFKDFEKAWVRLMDSVYEEFGSWENRKKYVSWSMEEL